MNSNKLVIRLNLEALEALFPEGSQHRVELQNSVLAQAAAQYVKGQLTPEVQKYLDNAVSKVAAHIDIEQHIGAAFAKKQGWSSDLTVKDGSHMASAIAERVRQELDSRHAERIDAMVKDRARFALAGLEEQIENAVNEQVASIAVKQINERVRAAIEAASQTLTNQI